MAQVGQRAGNRGARMINISASGSLRGRRTRKRRRSLSRTLSTPPEMCTRSQGTGGRRRRAYTKRSTSRAKPSRVARGRAPQRADSLRSGAASVFVFHGKSMYVPKFMEGSRDPHQTTCIFILNLFPIPTTSWISTALPPSPIFPRTLTPFLLRDGFSLFANP